SIDAILEMASVKRTGSCKGLIVAGCLYQRYRDELRRELPEVDAFVGCGELEKITEACRSALSEAKFAAINAPLYLYDHGTPRVLLNGVDSVYVKIAEGCDNRCSYCTIPGLRGNYRSRSADSVVKEVRSLLNRGAKEVNLVAQDTTYFGVPETGKEGLTSLLRALDSIRGRKWLRVLYTHPARITNAVARAIGDSRSVCHYLDMPIQHICDGILKAMRRKGSSYDIHRAIDILRDEISDIAIRTTLMVGFPGETDKHFERLLEFVQETRFDRLGVFKYSREPGTAAVRLGKQVPEDVKEERYEALMREQLTISRMLNRSLIGKRMEVLVEGVDNSVPNTVIGRTYRDAPEVDGFVRISYEGSPPIGEFIRAEITEVHDYDLEGKLL
ncbi:MAG: 30S ribosomal protein S12 methylthiotransferase RimO, partial [Candidatus Hydrogenedentota bacterium]